MTLRPILTLLAAGIGLQAPIGCADNTNSPPPAKVAAEQPGTAAATTTTAPPATVADTNLPTMEVAQAVMVTVELDFGTNVPSIAEGLREVERKYQPDDGKGRTFAILDAYGQPTPDGKKLHMSMHVSTEKPGIGELVFKRTGEVLWKNRILPATKPPSSSFAGKGLTIMVADDKGKARVLNGTKVKNSIFEATLNDSGEPLDVFWPEGEEREVTMIYSSCGCPVKAMARRQGDKTVRTKDTPVIFPDDLAVAATINKLMGWK